MKYKIEELKDITDSREIMQSKPEGFSKYMMYIIIGILTTVILWSLIATKEISIRASGVVKPREEITKISASLNGKVTTNNITEGMTVKAGDVLLVIEPAVDPMAAPMVEQPVMPEAAPVDAAVPATEEPAPVIYGGASPVVDNINVNQDTNHQIYGGADPLENTQTMPEVAPATPAVEQPAMVEAAPAMPEMAPMVEQPAMVEAAPAMPEVAPMVEQPAMVEAAPAMPEVAPMVEQPAMVEVAPAMPEMAPMVEQPAMVESTPAVAPVVDPMAAPAVEQPAVAPVTPVQ